MRLKIIRSKVPNILGKFHVLYIELVCRDLLVIFGQLKFCFHEHLSDGLAVLDVGGIAARTAHNHQLQYMFHVAFQLRINVRLIRLRKIAQMDALRRFRIDAAYQVPVDLLRHKRDQRRGCLCHGHKGGIQGHIGVDLILFHALCPETLPASAHIPVAHVFYKFLERAGAFRNPVILQIAVHGLYQRVQLGEEPFVHHGQGVIVRNRDLPVLCFGQSVPIGIEPVNVGIQHIERIGVPEGSHELALAFHDGLAVETIWQPGRAVHVEIPANRVCAVFFQGVKGVYRISL